MKIGKKMLAVVVAIIIVVAAVGVIVLTSPPAKGDAMELRLTYSNKVDYEPLIIAQAMGYFEDEGLNVTPLIVSGGIQSAEALATGSADMGAMGDAPTVTLMAKDMGAKMVASYGGGEGQHRLVGWADITNVSGLEGKKIGVQFGSSSQGALLRLLEANGLSADDVTQVSLSPADMFTNAPTSSSVIYSGWVVLIFPRALRVSRSRYMRLNLRSLSFKVSSPSPLFSR